MLEIQKEKRENVLIEDFVIYYMYGRQCFTLH